MKSILINISKKNLFKNFFKFPKANILFIFLVFGLSEWIISDLFNFSGGNLGFILLCIGGYFYFKSDKPKFDEPKDLNGWVKICKEDLDSLSELEEKDNPWRYSKKIENNMDVYDKLIFKYPPEINKLDILNNLKIIRKTLIRYASPLLLFFLLI